MRWWTLLRAVLGLLTLHSLDLAGREVHQTHEEPRKIVLLAGPKSHGPGAHEYVKTVRLLKVMLDWAAGLEAIRTEVHLGGWPADPRTLEDADLILTVSDGQDGEIGALVPFMHPDRLPVMARQMARGCGFAVIHFSTFAPDVLAPQMLEWGGGYFDWQDQTGTRNWYSAIETLEADVVLAAPDHPVARGLPASFGLRDEFYFNMRFREADPRLVPLARVPALGSGRAEGNTIAWLVERADGGRGFATTVGHFFVNWRHPHFRKLMLNAIVWAAGAEVPAEGVDAPFYTDREVTQHLFGARYKALVLGGPNPPAHEGSLEHAVVAAVQQSDTFRADVVAGAEALQYYDLQDYDVLVMHGCSGDDLPGLSEAAREGLVNYLDEGGGLLLLPLGRQLGQAPRPGAGASDGPAYRRICRRVWDADVGSARAPRRPLAVRPTGVSHPITDGLGVFQVIDALPYGLGGDLPVLPLLQADSEATGRAEPVAWVYEYGRGRVFQMVLEPASGGDPAMRQVLRRAARWAAGVPQEARAP